jgi:hypothetical protein
MDKRRRQHHGREDQAGQNELEPQLAAALRVIL